MCGIAGVMHRQRRVVDADVLERMATAIRHRGPDDIGIFCSDNVGLANVRLAVIDISSAGHQPMTSEDGSLTLVYNGELFNYRELADELRQLGRSFRSRSDTEVVLRAFEEWGPTCVERFNGMFALAVWNARERRLFLSRDRFGVKPLYYVITGDSFLFGSEIKALIQGGYRPAVSPRGMSEYFTFQNILSDATLFEGVRMLPAGHSMSVDDGPVAEPQAYWDLVLEPDESVGADEWVGAVRDAFQRAVTRQLVSDVPVGSYLSGGMDSASIAAVASATIPRLMTFTGGFDMRSVAGLELVFDERENAESIASEFRTEHYEMVMHAGDMAWVLPELVWHLEDLRVGMCYQNHYIARLASKFVTVALAGTGGDELFGGYPWRYNVVRDVPGAQFEEVHFQYWNRLVPEAEKPAFFTPKAWEDVSTFPALDAYRGVMAPAADLDPISGALYFEAKTFLHGLLIVEDRVSMAHGLEVRVPFLDNELVDIARRIPVRHQVDASVGKKILRGAMREFLPPEMVERPKQGFSPPDESWYRGPTMDYIREILLDPRTLERGVFQPAYVRRILAEHVAGKVNHRLLIWSLLSFEWWCRLFIDGDSAARHHSWHAAAPPRPREAGADSR